MANSKSSKSAQEERAGSECGNDEAERRDIVAAAAAEIHSLADIVIDRTSPDDDGRAIQSILRRVKRLTGIQLSALGDEMDDVASIRVRLNEGPEVRHE